MFMYSFRLYTLCVSDIHALVQFNAGFAQKTPRTQWKLYSYMYTSSLPPALSPSPYLVQYVLILYSPNSLTRHVYRHTSFPRQYICKLHNGMHINSTSTTLKSHHHHEFKDSCGLRLVARSPAGIQSSYYLPGVRGVCFGRGVLSRR